MLITHKEKHITRHYTVDNMNHEKNNGIFYTPPELASFVANLAISSSKSKILDPCYGEGALLLAAQNRLLELNSKNPHKQLYGYDISSPKNEVKKICLQGLLLQKNLKERDFFLENDEDLNLKFDAIVMNPPFVRHHLIPKETQKRIREIIGIDKILPMTSDLWGYFIAHSFKFIREGGSLVAILPWSFLHADFAVKIRKMMIDKFHTLQAVIIGQRMFKKVDERVLILIAKGFSFPTSELDIYYSFCIPKGKISWKEISRENWQNSLWKLLADKNIHNILSELEINHGFKPLGEFAKIRIGTVTGANNFFILDKHVTKRMRIPKRILKPIIRHSSKLRKLAISIADNIHDELLLIPDEMELPSSLEGYIKQGEKDGINNRHHTQNRNKWYSIPKQKPPDGFFHYMAKELPFIIMNPDRILSTNTIHNVDFLNDVDENMTKWIQFSMLTSISQLSIELSGRTYGGGVLKLEPTAASKILVYPGNGECFPIDLESKLNILLSKGKKREAMNLADSWMMENLNLSKDYMTAITTCYITLRDLRLGERD